MWQQKKPARFKNVQCCGKVCVVPPSTLHYEKIKCRVKMFPHTAHELKTHTLGKSAAPCFYCWEAMLQFAANNFTDDHSSRRRPKFMRP
jgi:hypothetical protein